MFYLHYLDDLIEGYTLRNGCYRGNKRWQQTDRLSVTWLRVCPKWREGDEKKMSGPVSEIDRFTRPLVSDLFRRHVPSGIYGLTSRAKYAFEVCGGNIH